MSSDLFILNIYCQYWSFNMSVDFVNVYNMYKKIMNCFKIFQKALTTGHLAKIITFVQLYPKNYWLLNDL